MAPPTKAQISAVREVLYKRSRLRQIVADVRSIDVLMNLNNPNQPGRAPMWRVPATGRVSASVKEAAERCRRIATAHRAMSREISKLELPARDKRVLRTGLDEQAAVWEIRSSVWVAPGKPDVKTVVDRIKSRQRAAFEASHDVRAYLRPGKTYKDLAG